MDRVTGYLSLLKNTFQEWSNDRAPRMGAAIAYYVTFSIAPLLIIAIAVAGLIFGEEAARGGISEQIQSTVGAGAARSIEEMLASASAPEGSTLMVIIGSVILLIGASGVFAELQDSLNTIFRVPPAAGSGIWNIIRRRFLSFAMVFVIGFLLLVSLVVSALISALGSYMTPESMPGGAFLWQAINQIVSLGIICVLFALIYKVLPDDDLPWRDVFVGAFQTAILFTVGKILLGIYLGQTSTVSSYGAAGSLVVTLVWVYYSAQILLFGAEFTRLYSIERGSGQQHREKRSAEAQSRLSFDRSDLPPASRPSNTYGSPNGADKRTETATPAVHR